ncbi:MAG: CoA transferase [Actinomycetota bacterium]|nr:CoA transferase [Actinomycetota bacterium]
MSDFDREAFGGHNVNQLGGNLDGLVVADFSRVLAGPYASMLLGDMGATVIKVESPVGDDTRHWVPPLRDGVGTYYLSINRNKYSIALDLSDPDDLATAHEIAARADIFIQNFKVGGLDKFNLDYESLRVINPSIIYCSISGFGSKEGASLPGYDLLVQAVSGLMSLTGDSEGEPYRAGISVFDVMTGLFSTIGILSALRRRETTGQGQHVETNLLSTALSALVNQTSAYIAGNFVPTRMGNAHLSLFPYEPLPTKDRPLIVIAGNDGQFERLAKVLGVEYLLDDDRFNSVFARNTNREVLRPILVEALSARDADEWFELLSGSGVPCGPINDVKGGVDLALKLGLDPVIEVDGVPVIRNPVTFSESDVSYRLAPPRLNQDRELILSWLSGGQLS